MRSQSQKIIAGQVFIVGDSEFQVCSSLSLIGYSIANENLNLEMVVKFIFFFLESCIAHIEYADEKLCCSTC